MDVKVPVNQPQVQPPGQPVVFRVSGKSGGAVSVSPRSLKTILAGALMLVLVSGVGVGVYLVGQQQQIGSKASNDSLQNIDNVVPKEIRNPAATLSAQPESSVKPAASGSADLSNIVVPELDNSPLTASDESSLNQLYDFNADGVTNSVDLSVMYSGWGTPATEEQTKADLNEDGTVNGLDYSIFLEHFNE